jgi:hypothetical protein
LEQAREVVSSFVLLPLAAVVGVVVVLLLVVAVVHHLELLCVSMMLLSLLLGFPLCLDFVTNDADAQTELDSVINDEDATIVLKQQKREKKLMASGVLIVEAKVVWSWTCYVLTICFLELVVAVELLELTNLHLNLTVKVITEMDYTAL